MKQDQKINNQSHQIAEVSLMDLWQVIARYYYVVLISVLLSVISAFLYIYSVKEEAPQPIYHASATLESGHYIGLDDYGTLEQKFLDFKINNELEKKINDMLNHYKKVDFDSLTREQIKDWNIGDTLFSLSISTRSLIIKSASKVSHESPVSLISKVVDFIQTEDTSFLESRKNSIKQKIKKLAQEINSKAQEINSIAQEIKRVEKQLELEIRELTIPWIQRGIYIERKIEYLEKQIELYLQQIAINEKLLANPLERYQILKNYDGPNISMIIRETDYRYQEMLQAPEGLM